MSESKMVTEREAVMRERVAYWNGMLRGNSIGSYASGQTCREMADAAYPFPKVERMRVVRDSDKLEWRVVGGRIEWRWTGSTLQWELLEDPDQYFGLTTERVKLLADLLANPTELVEDTP